MLKFTGERIVPEADNCEPLFALKMYQEHIARYLFAAQICAGKQVLDVGCGVGYGAHWLARRGAAQVTAFDLSEEAVRHARTYYSHPRVQHFVTSAEEFAFSRRFDVAVCFELIEHVDLQGRVLERIAETLVEDGVLVISTPRPTGTKRSAFHARELAFADFSRLLDTQFTHVHYFFENNHFASLVASEQPTALGEIHLMHPQFSLGQADYFVAVASRSALDISQFKPQLVLNDDSYVRNLERDVDILQRAERDWKTQVAGDAEQIAGLKAQIEAETGRYVEQLAASKALGQEETEARHAGQNETPKTHLQDQANQRDAETAALRTRLQDEANQHDTEAAALRFQTILAHSEMRAVERERDALRFRLSELESKLSEMYAWRDSSLQSLAEHQALVASLRAQMHEIHHSGSWRITAPLRRMVDVGLTARRWANGSIPERPSNGVAPVQGANSFGRLVLEAGSGTAEPRPPSVFQGKSRFDVMYVVGCHQGESKRYRVHNLAEALQELGYECAAILDSEAEELVRTDVQIRILILFRSGDTPETRRLIDWCRDRGTVVCFDIDDLVFEPESVDLVRVVSTFSAADRADYVRGVDQYRKVLLTADFVTCSTAFLAKRVQRLGKPAAVIPNSLNRLQVESAERLVACKRTGDGTIRIGYFSGSNTHKVDFQACEAALLSILDGFPECRFVLGGILELGAQWNAYRDQVERLPIMPYDQLLETLATLDINLAPLELGNAYCEGKSQLKIFEAGLVRVPTVASSTASYREAIQHGSDGFLASTQAEWEAALEKLVSDSALRQHMGRRARTRALSQFGPLEAAKSAVKVYGLSKRAVALAAVSATPTLRTTAERLKISWIVPGLIIGSGGHRNILRAAYHLERFGHDIELYFTSTDLTEEQLADAVRTHFYPLKCPMYRYQGSIRPTDVLFATHWSTMDIALAALRAKAIAGELMYFVQDFEPAFYPMGTEYLLAENTYRLGLYHITSGPWCEHILKTQFNAEADHFVFPIDTDTYHPRSRTKPEKNILFFAKPEMPRRCFDLGTLALEHFHRMRPEVEIILFGSPNADDAPLRFPAVVRSLVPTITDLAEMYANADLGIVFSTTNPSLVPYEMMACGLPVVDLGRPGNEINYGGRKDIAFLADPAPERLARQIAELLNNPGEREMRSRNGLDFVKTFPSEEQMARRVESLILARVVAKGNVSRAAVTA
jgi:glycosyltransferase involved in cell wall biosynthesis/SAM-dependent methyltransferase